MEIPKRVRSIPGGWGERPATTQLSPKVVGKLVLQLAGNEARAKIPVLSSCPQHESYLTTQSVMYTEIAKLLYT